MKQPPIVEVQPVAHNLAADLANADVSVYTEPLPRAAWFYASHGFTVLEFGQPLPPFFGRQWLPPNTLPPAWFFYKNLDAPAG
jgi:hypothetical protein